MIHHISLTYGSFWFADATLFRNTDIFNSCLQHIRQEVERSREDFIVDHYDRYTEPDLPPVWKTLEVTTFGTLSKLFCNFKDKTIKKRIAREFNLPQHVIYLHLCYLKYMLDSIKPSNHFTTELKDLLSQHPNVDVAAMGFPADWQEEPLWQ